MKLAANFKKFIIPCMVFTGVEAGAKTIEGTRAMESVTFWEYLESAADSLPSLSEFTDGSSSEPPFALTLTFFTLNLVA